MKFHINLRVSKHTKKEAVGKAPEYIVILADPINKTGRLEIKSCNPNIFTKLPLNEDFNCSLDNPQQTLDQEPEEESEEE